MRGNAILEQRNVEEEKRGETKYEEMLKRAKYDER